MFPVFRCAYVALFLSPLFTSVVSRTDTAFAQASARQAAAFDDAAEKWTEALRKATTPLEFQIVAEEALIKMDGAARVERFDAADKLAVTAMTAASRSRNAALRQEAAARKAEYDELSKVLQAARARRSKLDDEGYLVLGKYLCFVRADWEAGLGKLMMCGDETLKGLAWKTSLVKDDAAALKELGDLWWDESTKTSGRPKSEFQAGAAYLYARVIADLEPIEAAVVRKRLDEAARSAAKVQIRPGLLEVSLREDLGLRLRRVPAGKVLIGSPPNEPGRQSEEVRRAATIPRPFYIGVTEVTQAQFGAVLNRGNPSQVVGDASLPVQNVRWDQAQQFVTALNSRPIGRQYRFRLPTSAEWEYACRAGATTQFYFGNDAKLLDQFAWTKSNSGGVPKPVGGLRPNAWGLYDMLGNVGEWTATAWDAKLFPSPGGVERFTGEHMVARGGSFDQTAPRCRCAALAFDRQGGGQVGFRIVADIITSEAPLEPKPK